MSNLLRGAILAATMVAAPAVAETYVPPQTYTTYLQDRYYQAFGSAGYFGVIDPSNNRLPLNSSGGCGSGILCTLENDGSGVYINFTGAPRTSYGTNFKAYDDHEIVLKTGFQRRVYGNLVAPSGTIDEFVTIRFGLANDAATSMGYSLFYQTVAGISTLASGVLTADNPNFAFAQAFDTQDGDSFGMVFDYRGSNRNEAVYVYAALDYTAPGYIIPDPTPPPTVPEPMVWVQLLIGFFASGVLLRRRRGQPA